MDGYDGTEKYTEKNYSLTNPTQYQTKHHNKK